MYRNWMYGVGISLAGLLAVGSLESTTSAQTVVRFVGTAGEKRPLIEELRSAHKLLVEADHDYDGHRARAAEEVHKAIEDLEHKHAAKKVEAGTTTATPVVVTHHAKVKRTEKESQAASDAQLTQALGILKGVQSELATKHPKAAGNVSEAIANLNTALSIK